MRRIILAVILFIAFATVLFFINKPASRPNIIVILVDTLRADHLGAYGYSRDTSPNFDKLAKDSQLFTRAIASSSWTVPSVASLLSGLNPSGHMTTPVRERPKALKIGDRYPDAIDSMPEIFLKNGYQTAAITTNPWITKDFGFDQGFQTLDFFSRARAEKVIKSAKKRIDILQKKPDPFLLYMHFLDPHSPYTPPAAYEKMFVDAKMDRQYDERNQRKINLYDAEIRYFDDQLGEFIRFLKEKNIYDDTVIVFVSDHGEAFDEHGNGGHGYQLHIEEVHIPLTIKAPGFSGENRDTVSHIDVLPTLLKMAGIEVPATLPGLALNDKKALSARSSVLSELYRVKRQRSVTTPEGTRLIVSMGDTKKPTDEMTTKGTYDLDTDPYELNPIHDENLTRDLRGRLETALQESVPQAEAAEVPMDEKTMKTLETLGYLND